MTTRLAETRPVPPHLRCWNCGEPGVPAIGTLRWCPDCDVEWAATTMPGEARGAP
jgi:hypothetical protein